MLLLLLSYCLNVFLKGTKHEIFESGFFTHIRPVLVGDLGTSEKKMKFRKLESLIGGFRCEYLIKRMIINNQKTFKIAKKNLCETP